MPTISRSALVPHSAAQMYAIVNDVEHYPEFVPWCSGSEFKMLADNQKQATLHFSRGTIKTAFTTRNTLTEGEIIAMQLLDGPFKQLHGAWTFTDIDDIGSRVELALQFELSNPMLKIALEAFFNQLCDRMVSSFVERARQLY
ncbi:MAG: type II toxin-antitoxin system RatA family toxin [Candidatus Thioglobus sp.]|nr:MAG: type II toxin-antitoxin system RatA family toxin [Candidatus Thioglobus sp.]|tara:strand:+ start:1410 stop:1838 length:429 start_codon:yes stop_codon:yes gene_type:complete